MTADKFGREYAQDQSAVMDEAAKALEQRAIMREALRDAWQIFDQLGAHQSDDQRLSILHSPEFSSAAYRVRTAMLKTSRCA
jgi:hypothetical protein